MTRSAFLEKLEKELKQYKVPDVREIIEEYEQHFAFKMEDGFTEEEIAGKLGNPQEIAAQFDTAISGDKRGTNRTIAVIGLFISCIAALLFFILLLAWGIVLGTFSISSVVVAFSLIAEVNPGSLIPFMPYTSAVTFGIAIAALAILSAIGCIWFAAFLRQLTRVYGRFHHNTMAAATGKPILPSVAAYPNFQAKVKRRLRRVALISISIFAVFFILGIILSILSAGSLGFWHAWGWFGYMR
ncbi:MAG: DUF1700 domain-containing protein [Fastidiosipila sp.]|nr:DUF1700 domain-containing protein [Fastidiosipila sp.]